MMYLGSVLGGVVQTQAAEQADAVRLLELARQYWSIENSTRCPLDVSAGEDRRLGEVTRCIARPARI